MILSVLLGLTPYCLPIGRPGTFTLTQPAVVSTEAGKVATFAQIAEAALTKRFVLIGESHTSRPHHLAQAAIIEALVKSGRSVVVGMEMFTRDNQRNVAPFSRGYWSDEEFQVESKWKTQWGFDYGLYKPVFDVIRSHHLPLVALNVPRAWVTQVGKEGPASLSPQQKEWVPSVDTTNRNHRMLFDSLMGGHPVSAVKGENMYAAMVVWDTGMAQTAFEEAKSRPGSVIVILAGSGHVMYGQGIAYRLAQLGAKDSLIVTGIDLDAPTVLSRGIADFVVATPPPAE